MTLDQADAGSVVQIVSIDDGKGVKSKLSQMGLSEGDSVTIVKSGPLGGPIIVAFKNSEFVIGRGLAKKIHIS